MRSDVAAMLGAGMVNRDFEASTDADLVRQARAGNEKAVEVLINRHYLTCVKVATLMLRDPGDAQDEVQEACCKAFQHIDQFRGDTEFLAWLLRIVSNQCLILLRSRRRARFVFIDAEIDREGSRPMELRSFAADPEREFIDHEMKRVLANELRRIPPLFRDVLLLRDLQELPMSNVAKRLRISEAAAKSRLQRARTELRERVLKRSTLPRFAQARMGRPTKACARKPDARTVQRVV